MLACPACGNRRLEICGHIADNSGYTKCRSCGHTARPRAFLRDEVIPVPVPLETGYKCPICGSEHSFVVSRLIINGPVRISADGWLKDDPTPPIAVDPSSVMMCEACNHTGRVSSFIPRKELHGRLF